MRPGLQDGQGPIEVVIVDGQARRGVVEPANNQERHPAAQTDDLGRRAQELLKRGILRLYPSSFLANRE